MSKFATLNNIIKGRRMPTEETPIIFTVNTDTSIHGHQQSYEMEKTNDLEFVLEYYSQLTDAERYRLLTCDDPKSVVLLDTLDKIVANFSKHGSCLALHFSL